MNKLNDYNRIKDFYENTCEGRCLCKDFSEKHYYYYFNVYWKQNAGEEIWLQEIDSCAEEIGLDVSDIENYNDKLDLVVKELVKMHQIYLQDNH